VHFASPPWSASDTRRALNASQAGFAGLLAAALPGAALHGASGMAWVDSALPDDAFNFVYRVAPPESDADLAAGAARVIEHFQRRGLPFRWSVGLRGEAPRDAEVLTRCGLRFVEQEPGMGLHLSAPRELDVAPPGLEIRAVTDAGLLRAWMAAWSCGAPEDVVERWYHVYAALPYGPHGRLRLFVGFIGGEPVATVYVHLVEDCATVHYVVTRPEARRRGLGAAMTRRVLHEARAAGCRAAVLCASDLGRGIYERLGFREACRVSTYVWRPDQQAAAA
jgi:ribosomal protein S18 acetylase RimI-like enzyme